MELFDKQFVRFMWDDALKGKKCFVSDYVDDLKGFIEHDRSDMCLEVVGKGTANYPFEALHNDTHNSYQFAYYDPNHSIKKAFNEGKTIQVQISESYWKDISSEPDLLFVCDKGGILRIKPENEKKWIVYLNREIQFDGKDCYLTACREDRWESVQKDYGAKTKLFIGSESEVLEWYKAREKFASLIKAWEDGKTIEFFNPIDGIWSVAIKPIWEPDLKYRVKPECPCDVGIDSKACVGCPQSEDGKKEYRPYKDSAEMVADFVKRFKVKCPSYCEPLIWMKHKRDANSGHLITDFFHGAGVRVCGGFFSFEALLYEYTYLDGSPCGAEVKE